MTQSERHEAYLLEHPIVAGPVVVDVPHAGLEVPAWARAQLAISPQELAVDADLHMDRVAARVVDAGAPLLIARLSRFVIDLNRTPDQVDGDAVEGAQREQSLPRGAIWRRTTDGARSLTRPLTQAAYAQRLAQVYHPYRDRLRALLDEAHARTGLAVLLDVHSCPSIGKEEHADRGVRRADAILGWRGGTTCAPFVIEAAEQVLRRAGLDVVRDLPYSGAAIVAAHGDPSSGRHAIQLELSRRIYMDERGLGADEKAIAWLQPIYRALVEAIASACDAAR